MLAWDGEQYIATGERGAIATSTDGAIWTSRESGTLEDLGGPAWNGEIYVILGEHGTVLTSPDGVKWSRQVSCTDKGAWYATWNGRQFLAMTLDGIVLSSPDGVSWTCRDSGLDPHAAFGVGGPAWGPPGYIAVRYGDWSNALAFSRDGVTWSWVWSAARLYGYCWTGSRFVVIEDGNSLLSSPDGESWTQEELPSSFFSYGPCAAGGPTTLIVGQLGKAIWTVCPNPPPSILNGVKRHQPFELMLIGSNFQEGCTVTIGGQAKAWPKVVNRGSVALVLKGGTKLKKLFPKGADVPITVTNPDGQSATLVYRR